MLARNDFLDFQFIGAGAREALWLRHALGEHPSIALPSGESGSRRHAGMSGRTGFSAAELANRRADYDGAGPLTILGSIDPDLMFDPNAASRLASAFPQLKLICFLRDPAELILDLYHERARTHRVRPCLLDELERRPEWLDRTRYHRHLLPFLDRFHPDQICLVIYERFFAREYENFQRLCAYLDVDGEFRPSPVELTTNRPGGLAAWSRHWLERLRPAGDGGPQAAIDEESRMRILDQLHGELGRLEQALAIRLDLWRGSATSAPHPNAIPDNVIALPCGAERRQRLAQRKSRQEVGG